MGKEIRIRITADGKVEIDSTVFEHCMEVAEVFKQLGEVESISEKDQFGEEVRIKLDTEK